MTSKSNVVSANSNILVCRHWWKVCWIYGDQQKYYRQLYGRRTTATTKVTQDTIATSTTTVLSLQRHEEPLEEWVNSSGDDEIKFIWRLKTDWNLGFPYMTPCDLIGWYLPAFLTLLWYHGVYVTPVLFDSLFFFKLSRILTSPVTFFS